MSKINKFINTYLDSYGNSVYIERYKLEPPFYYTSGDGIFRMDGKLPKIYKMITIKGNKKIRYSWAPTDNEIEQIRKDIKTLNFSTETKPKYSVYYIKFFGKNNKLNINKGIRSDIKDYYSKQHCANCGYKDPNDPTQVDHKNDLMNDPRVWNLKEQKLDDFQPLCRRCNCIKRSFKKKMLEINKRISAKVMGYNIDFISGDETLDKNDPNWYKGTYWGDILEFKRKLKYINDVNDLILPLKKLDINH